VNALSHSFVFCLHTIRPILMGTVSPLRKLFRTHGNCSALIEIVSHSWRLFPIQGNCFPFIGTASHSRKLLPIHWGCFPFIGIIPHSLGLFPIHWDCFPFMGIVSPLSFSGIRLVNPLEDIGKTKIIVARDYSLTLTAKI